MSMLEAECTRCREVFVPHGIEPEDIIHGETEAGEECGGIGIIQGEWGIPGETTWAHHRAITAQEKHGKEYPDCEDPDCEFHHPEVIEG